MQCHFCYKLYREVVTRLCLVSLSTFHRHFLKGLIIPSISLIKHLAGKLRLLALVLDLISDFSLSVIFNLIRQFQFLRLRRAVMVPPISKKKLWCFSKKNNKAEKPEPLNT